MHVIRVVKSVLVGLLLIASAVGCFFAADFIVNQTAIEQWVVLSAFGPVENVFLLLFTPVIAVTIILFRLSDSTGSAGTPRGLFIGLAVFLGCELSAGLFGIPGVGVFLAVARLVAEGFISSRR